MNDAALRVLSLNIACPSSGRAERLLSWLGERDEQVFVLTETGSGSGSALMMDRFRDAGWAVQAPLPRDGERGVMMCSRLALRQRGEPIIEFLSERVEVASIGGVEIIGVYAPSRDASPARIARKRRFLAELLTTVGEGPRTRRLLIGDLNIVERSQRREGGFFDWEYDLYDELPRLGWLDAYRVHHPHRVEQSWVGTDGQGFRFDHAFITADLLTSTQRCEYVHEPRETELTDHSAMAIEITGASGMELDVSPSLEAGPPSLF